MSVKINQLQIENVKRVKEEQMRNKRNNCAEAVRCLIALFAIGLGMVLLFVAAGLVDGTGSAKEVTVYGLLALLSFGGGIIGLKMGTN